MRVYGDRECAPSSKMSCEQNKMPHTPVRLLYTHCSAMHRPHQSHPDLPVWPCPVALDLIAGNRRLTTCRSPSPSLSISAWCSATAARKACKGPAGRRSELTSLPAAAASAPDFTRQSKAWVRTSRLLLAAAASSLGNRRTPAASEFGDVSCGCSSCSARSCNNRHTVNR